MVNWGMLKVASLRTKKEPLCEREGRGEGAIVYRICWEKSLSAKILNFESVALKVR